MTDDRWTNCPFCGVVLLKATINPLRAVVAPERFVAVEQSPQFAALMRHQPSSARHLVGNSVTTVFLILFTVASGVMTVLALTEAGPVAIVPLIICFVGAAMLLRQVNSASKFAKAKVQREVSVWRDERIQVSGGRDRAAVTRHYVLLETRNGRRQEFECSDELAGAHASGDIGVAFLRGDVLLDFRRVDA